MIPMACTAFKIIHQSFSLFFAFSGSIRSRSVSFFPYVLCSERGDNSRGWVRTGVGVWCLGGWVGGGGKGGTTAIM